MGKLAARRGRPIAVTLLCACTTCTEISTDETIIVPVDSDIDPERAQNHAYLWIQHQNQRDNDEIIVYAGCLLLSCFERLSSRV